MSHYTVTASWALSHGMLTIGTWGGGDTNVYMATQIVKGPTIKQVKKVIVKSKEKKRGKITLDDAKLIQLGGSFQAIGDADEDVGGKRQKVGSDNQ